MMCSVWEGVDVSYSVGSKVFEGVKKEVVRFGEAAGASSKSLVWELNL